MNKQLERYDCLYGDREAWAYPENHENHINYRYFSIHLKKDPGYGSMSFYCIGRSQILFIEQPPNVPEKWWEV